MVQMQPAHSAEPPARATSVAVVTFFHPNQPGYLDFSYRVRSLAQHYRVTVICRDSILALQEFQGATFDELVLATPDGSFPQHVRYMLQAATALRRLRPDAVLHLGSSTAAVALWGLAGRSAVYWNEHPSHYFGHQGRVWYKKPLFAALRKATYAGAARAALVMPIGEAHRDDVLQHGVPAARCKLLYMGVSARFEGIKRSPDPAEAQDELRLIYTGTVMAERGRDVMIDAVALARAAGVPVRLTLVGADQAQQQICRERAAAQGVQGQVLVVGRVPGEQIPAYLAQADAGLCLWEDREYWRFNPPTKLFEYLTAGLPVLASDIRTHSAYIVEGQNGYLFEYGAAPLAGAIQRMWAARGQWRRLHDAALSSGARHRWAQLEPEFLFSMQQVLKSGAASRPSP